jgi:hypothetical protein
MTKKTEIVYNNYKSKNFRAHILSYFLVVTPYRDKKNQKWSKTVTSLTGRNALYYKTIIYTSGFSMLFILFKIQISESILFYL